MRSSSATATTGIADLPTSPATAGDASTSLTSPGTAGEVARSAGEGNYVGRFAPSPSGPLHFGSLVAAVGSFLDARAHGGRWLVRIEDLDPPRERAGAADDILRTLEALALHWDGPVLRQSGRTAAYAEALARLGRRNLLHACECTRSELAALPENRARESGIADELFHPRRCPVHTPGASRTPGQAWRLRVPQGCIGFDDRSLGPQSIDVAATVGNFVLRRRDGLFAYQLAVVVDDAHQGVTDVVRGCDLLTSTARQLLLQQALGLPTPRYLHLPLAVDDRGLKLSKSEDAPAADRSTPAMQLVAVLGFLGQSPPCALGRASAREVLDWAREHWRVGGFAGRAAGTAPLGVITGSAG
ncbi:MAG TPA: tRNA glutamyl-Q(34) synthetase GluQRS [Steroidobacteraceae bacterium]|nr:tRNA glutamyl-Q(34) synthetase GluQRS [Steroidobacteraceae bacterium]